MHETAVERLIGAAREGRVDHDGLRATREADGFTFAVHGTEREGLSASAFRDAAADHPAFVGDWYFWRDVAPDQPARRAFLRWLERAADEPPSARADALSTGCSRTWGQLSITVESDAMADRTYEIRHVEDDDASAGALERYSDPLDARELAKHDEDGRYRPLKTAPTLRSGWVYSGLDAVDCCQVVEFVYPATVANWHRERSGELDVSHYRETAERQTGIYDVIDELDREAVEWMAEACCVDSQCLKRREWDEDAETELEVPRGDGVFPCREPCSLLVAAARKWTTLEREAARTYEFELTPSEKAQLEDLIDAVADDRVDEIREADVYDGANRYRARYLRAKRFSDGELCGVPTEETDADSENGH